MKREKGRLKAMAKGNLLHFPLKNKMSIVIDLKHVYQSQWSLAEKMGLSILWIELLDVIEFFLGNFI